jgi:peptide/nickel transport system permease protein
VASVASASADSRISSEQKAAPLEAGLLSVTWQRFLKRKSGLAGLLVLLLIVLSVIVIPVFSPFDIHAANGGQSYAPAGTANLLNGHTHIMGTDYLGRDAFTRFFVAGRTSLALALFSTAVIVVLGTIVGAIAGYYGGLVDTVLMRFTDFMLALPLLPVYLLIIRYIRSTFDAARITDTANPLTIVGTIALVFIIFGWMGLSRLVRGSVLTLRSQEYVDASKALGAGGRHIILKHLIPNSIGPIMVAATFAAGDFIILETILAYFGQGLYDPPALSWGNLIAGAQNYVWYTGNLNPFQEIRGYLVFVPSTLILLTVLSINYVADALRDALDPRQNA